MIKTMLDTTAFLSISFNSDKPYTEKKPLTWAFQMCLGFNYCLHTQLLVGLSLEGHYAFRPIFATCQRF